jgi:hypothetical protein
MFSQLNKLLNNLYISFLPICVVSVMIYSIERLV